MTRPPATPAWLRQLGAIACKNGVTFIVANRDSPSSWTRGRRRWSKVDSYSAAWLRGYVAGKSVAMRRMSDEPSAPDAKNPYEADQ